MSNYICEELVTKIFGSLPSKSLIRFRSLSRTWYSRISSPDFIRKHTLQSVIKPQKALVKQEFQYREKYVSESCTQIEIPSSREYLFTDFDIVGSCNGIICLLENEFDISLWNPSIRRKLTLPHQPFKGSNIAVGFGFDPISDDYKIVRISYSCDRQVKDSFVYALKTRAWCPIASPTNELHDVRSHVCFVNGVLHWMVKSNFEFDDELCTCIMTFDLGTHIFGMISLPLWVPISVEGSIAPWNDDWIKVIEKNDNNVASFSMDLEFKSQGLLEVYNPETGVCTKLVHLIASQFNVEMSMCVETLELLDTGTRCNGFVGTLGKRSSRYRPKTMGESTVEPNLPYFRKFFKSKEDFFSRTPKIFDGTG